MYGSIVIMRCARRTLSLSVNAKGEVVVRAPKRTRDADIERFVARHSAWIERKRREIARAKPDLSDGATLELCGKKYTIAAGSRARIAGDLLVLPQDRREDALIGLLRRVVRARMQALCASIAARYGFTYATIRISSARGRWGSCSTTGTISFSYRTAFLTDREAYYLAAHELCHTHHMDHSPAFWKEVEAIVPDQREIRKGLQKRGAIMLFF